MNFATIRPYISWILRTTSNETAQPLNPKEISEAVRRGLETELKILETETNPEMLKAAEARFLGICTEEQKQGHNIRAYWDRYEEYRDKPKTYN